MFSQNEHTVSLDNFQGPVDLLLYLVQKEELDVFDISLSKVAREFLEANPSERHEDLDPASRFLLSSSSLALIKSRLLLQEDEEEELEEECDPRFELIHDLLAYYCHFRDLAKSLGSIEEQEREHFYRGFVPPLPKTKKGLGLRALKFDELETLFAQVLEHAPKLEGDPITDETWQVSDKIAHIQANLKTAEKIPFLSLFSSPHREELVVTFLAILELMKISYIKIFKDISSEEIFILSSNSQPAFSEV